MATGRIRLVNLGERRIFKAEAADRVSLLPTGPDGRNGQHSSDPLAPLAGAPGSGPRPRGKHRAQGLRQQGRPPTGPGAHGPMPRPLPGP